MSCTREWWQGRMPEGHGYVGCAFSYAEYVRQEVGPDELAEDLEGVVIFYPDGTLEAPPATHAGWSVWEDLNRDKWPWDDGRDCLPRPVVLIDLRKHAAACGEVSGGREAQ